MRTQLKKLTMYNKVKGLSREGLSIRQISRNTGLDRATVRKYLRMTEEEFSTFLALQKQRNRKLQPYEEFIKKRVADNPDCSAAQVEDWLKEHHPDLQEITTRTIYSFVQWIRKSHDIPKPKGTPRYYQPVEQLPYGEQAQVDFGEYWMVNADECKVKVHFMIMLLSRSRQKFVSFSQQPITTRFVVEAHEQAFAFFEGIPHTLVYDQDSTIVTDENRGAILYTEAFKKYLLHRGLKIHLCRKSDPESKGKIEAGVKYVKHNFLPGRSFVNLDALNQEVLLWLHRTANAKEHATTRLIPEAEWQVEKRHLRPFEPLPYPISGTVGKEYHVRKDNTISYRGNFYTLPVGTYEGPGTLVVLEVRQNTLVLNGQDGKLLANHPIESGKGIVVINTNHRRDTSAKLGELQRSLMQLFTNQEQAGLFLESIHNRYPRYSRDQFLHVRNTINGCQQRLIDDALAHCVDHHLFSSGEFHDILQHYRKQEEKQSHQAVFNTFRPKTLRSDMDRILSFVPDSSGINTYQNIFS